VADPEIVLIYTYMKTALHLIILITASTIIAQTKLYQVIAVLTPAARYHLNDLYDGAQTKA
jgi:hypothetical protein